MGRYDALLQEEERPIAQSPTELSSRVTTKSPKKDLRLNPPTIQTETPQTETEQRPFVEAEVRPSPSAPVRTPVRIKRTITRYAFEFFQDQIETLKKFSIEEQIRGEKGSMSQMVREALDAYIAKRKRTEE